MFSTKTNKALCLSLLVPFAIQISAEGWLDRIKEQLTPKKVAITCVAASGLFYHYWFKRRKTKTITIDGRTIDVSALNLELSNYEHIDARITPGHYLTQSDEYNLDQIVVDNNDNQLFGFSPQYRLEDDYTEKRTVSLVYNKRLGQMHLPWNWFGCMCCSNSRANYLQNDNDLAGVLYSSLDDKTVRTDYADQLHEIYTRNCNKIAEFSGQPKTDDIVGAIAILKYQNTGFLNKHTRVMGSLSE